MTDQQIVKLAQKALPLLDALLGAAAVEVRRKLKLLLALAAKQGAKAAAGQIFELLAGNPALKKWMRETAPKSVPKGLKGAEVTAVEVGAAGTKLKRYQVVTIHYATDRAGSASKKPSNAFGRERAIQGKITYGTCDVSIPFDRKKGQLPRPSWRKLEFREDPEKHVVLLKVTTLDPADFFASAAQHGKQAFVFVHGFNVSFEEAARRTAQIAWDLPFDGLPVLYSWPSQGKMMRRPYQTDEANIEWTIPHLQQFLTDLVAKGGIETLHLIGHSMGNRAIARALQLTALQMPGKVDFHEVIFSAPDIDAGTFADLAKQFLKAARRVTLYASAGDEALKFSTSMHGNPRAGDSRGGILVVPGMDSIDATGVDVSFLGHSYIGSEKSVLTDVFYALRGDLAADRKATIKRDPSGTHYRFVL